MRCVVCGKKAFSEYCFAHKLRNPIYTTTKPHRRKKYLRKVGKVGRQWIATRKEWISKNLPDSGVWNCYYCGKDLHLNELTIDHKMSRSRHPELRFELTNLVPACWGCNSLKGSQDAEEFMEGFDGRKYRWWQEGRRN